jgi:hypothetical protein
MKKQLAMLLRGKWLVLVGTLLLTASCNKDLSNQDDNGHGSSHTGVRVFLTDDPSLVFDHIFIDIVKLEIKAEDHDQSEHEREHQGEVDDDDHHGSTSGGWIILDIHPGVYDILKFRNGLDTLLATGNFPNTHELRKVRLTLGSNNSVVFNGNTFPLGVKNNDHFVIIKLSDDFAGVGSLGQIDFSLDLDAGRSIRKHDDQFELDAQIKAFRKEKAGSIEGRVSPDAAQAVIMAINGNDTTTARPEREGEFKIVGLKSGSYSLLFHATANNYKDSLVQQVIVDDREDTHIATMVLHQ